MKPVSLKHAGKEWMSFLQKETHSFNAFVVVLIYEKEYPLSFISYYIQKNKHIVTTIDLADTQNSISLLEQMLGTTFLGHQCTYVIKTPWQELTPAQQKFLLQVIHAYKGPHFCIIPVERTAFSALNNDQAHVVAVPDLLTSEEAILFANQSFAFSPVFQKMLKNGMQGPATISFHMMVLFFNYSSVISNNIIDDFSEQMMPTLLGGKQSLYELSGQLFNKKSSFFKMWHAVEPTYSLAFWTTFWSDQIMKASLFCAYKRHGALQEAQLIGTGLPFSFLNKDWRLYSSQGLLKGHTVLYEYDCRLKDHVLIKSLDSWFIMFFMHTFDQ